MGSGLPKLMVDYFNNVFVASDNHWDNVKRCMQRDVSNEHNMTLLTTVEENEVKATLFQMIPDKSPSPNGFNPGFYQKFWGIIGRDIVKLVYNFFSNKEVPEELNDTHIVLIVGL